MRLLRGLTKAAVITKVIDEARKPHNQVKLRQLASKLSRGKRSGPDAAGRPPLGRRESHTEDQ